LDAFKRQDGEKKTEAGLEKGLTDEKEEKEKKKETVDQMQTLETESTKEEEEKDECNETEKAERCATPTKCKFTVLNSEATSFVRKEHTGTGTVSLQITQDCVQKVLL
jgi:hypothetical protein